MMHTSWIPPADLFETQNNITVRVEVAGMRDEDFSIELNGRNLIVRGTRNDISERRNYYQMEIQFGEFSLELTLPSPVDAQKVEAIYENGFLRIQLPKASPRRIPIEA
jgi:HSP20 family protein